MIVGPATTPPLAVTLGDPAGIGPEIIVKAWWALRASGPEFVVIGDADELTTAFATGSAAVERVADPLEGKALFRRALPVIVPPRHDQMLSNSPAAARAREVVRWIETAVELALSGAVGGVVTGPIAKAPLYDAGFPFPGHTEMLAALTADAPMSGLRGPVMMLAAADLRAALVTIHTPLAQAPHEITIEKVVHTARVTHEALVRDFGVESPRLVLPALNPHAGEGGAIGREEIEILAPAASLLRAEGVDISDPRPADTLFHAEARRTYDAAICLYHDQALIPVKTLDFWGGVNITLGLPIVRCSPDHGVGYDIAGKGVARADSMIAAIRQAAALCDRRVRP